MNIRCLAMAHFDYCLVFPNRRGTPYISSIKGAYRESHAKSDAAHGIIAAYCS